MTLIGVLLLAPDSFELTVDRDGHLDRYAFRGSTEGPLVGIHWNRPVEAEFAREFGALRALKRVAGRLHAGMEIALPVRLG
ncbi:hypothetical protein Lfu02_43950 [Longispora fulva]|nr:hypothetical protein Lfu02_43950 [Longispora fulva]